MLIRVSSASNLSLLHLHAARLLHRAIHTVVPAEAAQAVAQSGEALTKLPSDVRTSLEDYIKASGLTSRTAKLRALALTDNLKRLSRSKRRGGVNPFRDPSGLTAPTSAPALLPQDTTTFAERRTALADAVGEENAWVLKLYQQPAGDEDGAGDAVLRRPASMYRKSGPLKSKALPVLEQLLSAHGPAALTLPELHAVFGLPPPPETATAPHLSAARDATPAYGRTECHAYVLSRLAGCFAAVQRVVGELAVRLPGFQPKMMLDYGAGPGTAAWAAQEVWWRSLQFIHAVEPSPFMQEVGRALEVGRRFATPAAPLVSWHGRIPPNAKRRGHDVVVASYVLTEVGGAEERWKVVRKLWGLTKDVLILVEPGTPLGSANIQEARSQILRREQRRAGKISRRMEQQAVSDVNLSSKAARIGAHVVAPCPHDGVCPLVGTTSWCHFGTRFHRPGFMQAAKAPQGSRSNAYDHQHERYSFIVLRRGPRPEVEADVQIARTRHKHNQQQQQKEEQEEELMLLGSTFPQAATVTAAARLKRGGFSEPTAAAAAEPPPSAAAAEPPPPPPLSAAAAAIPAVAVGSALTETLSRDAATTTASSSSSSSSSGSSNRDEGLPHATATAAAAASNGGQGALPGQGLSDTIGPLGFSTPGGEGLVHEENPEALLGLPASFFEEMATTTTTAAAAVGEERGGEGTRGQRQAEVAAARRTQAAGRATAAAAAGVAGEVEFSLYRPLPAAAAGIGTDPAGGGGDGGVEAEQFAAANAKMGPYGFGLIDRLMALEKDGVDWTKGGDALPWEVATTPAAAAAAAGRTPPAAAGRTPAPPAAAAGRTPPPPPAAAAGTGIGVHKTSAAAQQPAAPGGGDIVSSLGTTTSSSSIRGNNMLLLPDAPAVAEANSSSSSREDIVVLPPDPAAVAEAAAASGRWARIIRPPRKRSGHVILDLCMPLAASEQSGTPSTGGKSSSGSSSSSGTGSSSGRSSRRSSSSGRLAVQSSQGHLERHVVSRSDAAKWMGSAGYALARSSQWGDLWPSFYNLNPKRQVLRQGEEVVEMQGRAGEEAE